MWTFSTQTSITDSLEIMCTDWKNNGVISAGEDFFCVFLISDSTDTNELISGVSQVSNESATMKRSAHSLPFIHRIKTPKCPV